jgi:glycosyltransferase involved in cell wall biosynthesis
MNIVEVIDIGFEAGGAERQVKLLRDRLTARGHDVRVIATDKSVAGSIGPFADVVIPHIQGPAWRRMVDHAWYGAAFEAVARTVRSMPADVVHLHTIGEFSPSVLRACGEVPMVLTVHGPEEYVLDLLPYKLRADDYRHRSYLWEDLRPVGRARYWYYRGLQRPNYRAGLRRVATIVAPSAYMALVVGRDVRRVPIEQIHNGIDLPAPQPVPHAPNIVYVGRLEVVKGVEYLVTAAAIARPQVPGLHVTIVGDGSERARLEARVTDMGLAGTVDFVGWVPSGDVVAHIAQGRALVIPSVGPEILCVVAIEAMGVGRAIIGSDAGGIPELVTPGTSGYLVEPRDAEGLANAMVRLCRDDVLAARMGAAGRQLSKRFDADTFVGRVEALYDRVRSTSSS